MESAFTFNILGGSCRSRYYFLLSLGYSVNQQSLDTYNFTDNNVAKDNYNALLDFFNNKF